MQGRSENIKRTTEFMTIPLHRTAKSYSLASGSAMHIPLSHSHLTV